MKRDFTKFNIWTEQLNGCVRDLLALALAEDVSTIGDLTSLSIIPSEIRGKTVIRSRENGVISGLRAAECVVETVGGDLTWSPCCQDGEQVVPGQEIACFTGPVLNLLGAERILLNFIGHMSGVATKTYQFVQEIKGTGARIYDTRKTLPGWRFLDKYAVSCGGGHNHRLGLFDNILIKDNHLACSGRAGLTPADAVLLARNYLRDCGRYQVDNLPLVEIEVDTLEQLALVLPVAPDIVLLDNMGPDLLRKAVDMRNEINREIELEASGGINMTTVRAAAMAGVDRISVGALTHSAPCFDVGLDWI